MKEKDIVKVRPHRRSAPHVTLTIAAQTLEASVGRLEHRASEVEGAPEGPLARSSVSRVRLHINHL